MKKHFHIALLIPLDAEVYARNGKFITRRTFIDKAITSFFEKDIVEVTHCPNCGGILPELQFEYKGKTYCFTCYRIEKDGKAIVKTDYEKFAEYCRGMSSTQ